jgi:biotin-dependent carboxylase-like uncharacterized protein
MTTVEVLSPGPLTSIQDLGRPGWAHIGVPRSGAADRPALRLANRLVGNHERAPALETTLIGPGLRFDGPAVVALTGATVDGVEMNTPLVLRAEDVLKVGRARRGLRTYIAFQGGIDAPLTLGSAATDVLTGLGPKRLERGDLLRMQGERASGAPPHAPPPRIGIPDSPIELPDLPVLRLILGPREDWFTSEAIRRLTTEPYRVDPASNRIGLRLSGLSLDRDRPGELPSEGLVPGAIQVPATGQPIMLLVDHPTTGGYPVIAVVHSDDLPLAAQVRPGDQIRMRVWPPPEVRDRVS